MNDVVGGMSETVSGHFNYQDVEWITDIMEIEGAPTDTCTAQLLDHLGREGALKRMVRARRPRTLL